MSKLKINTEKETLSKILGKEFFFNVPSYQRHYVWEIDNINALLEDLWFAYENEKESEYFLGSLVLQSKIETNTYDVLDGQQRLTSLLLIFACLRDSLDNKEIQQYLQQKANDLEKIDAKNKLDFSIRGDVGSFFEKYIISFDGTNNIDEYENSNKNISVMNMKSNIKAIKSFLEGKDKQQLFNFCSFLLTQVIVIYIATQDLDDAMKIFTIINARGIKLGNSDILKATNLSEIKDKKINETYARRWEELEEYFGEDFEWFMALLRTTILKNKARKNLLDEFNKDIYENNLLKIGTDTIDYMQEFKNYYAKLINLDDGFGDNKYKSLIKIMKLGLNSSDWVAPLLYFYKKFKSENLFPFLQKLENKSLIDWVIGETPTPRLENMNRILKAIQNTNSSDELIQNSEIFETSNTEFERIITSTGIYGKRFCKYLLLRYEFLKQDNSMPLDFTGDISIEHILPQNPEKISKWNEDFDDSQREFWTHNIANLVLIHGRKNPALSNHDFELKKDKLKEKSKVGGDYFKGSNFVFNQEKWTIDELNARRKDIIDTFLKL